jgi:hypothetical protein
MVRRPWKPKSFLLRMIRLAGLPVDYMVNVALPTLNS